MTDKIIYPYVRFSSGEQAKGDSLRRQMNSISRYAEQNGFVINDSLKLKDLGKSAYKGENLSGNAGLARFLIAIEKGLVPTDGSAYLCVEQLDRLTRKDIREAQNLFEDILSENINIITLMDSKVYTKDSLNSMTDLIYSIIIMNQSHIESQKKSERVKASFQGRLKKIRKGEKAKYASQLPSWVDEETPKSGIFHLNDNAEIVKRIFSLAIEDMPLNEIARLLNQEGIPRITRSNYKNGITIWTGANISHIIKSEQVTGRLNINSYETLTDPITGETKKKKVVIETIENYYPRLISDREYYAANQRVLLRRTSKERGRKTLNNLFSSLLYCGDCLQRIHFEIDTKKLKGGIKKYKSLKCSSRRFKSPCKAVTINYDSFELEFPQVFLMNSEIDDLNISSNVEKLKDELLVVEEELSIINNKIDDLENSIASGEYSIQDMAGVLSKMRENQRSLKKKEGELTGEILFKKANREFDDFDYRNENDRKYLKEDIRNAISGIIIYTREKVAWIIYKGGNAHAYTFGDGSILNTMSDFRDFVVDIKEKIATGKVDPKLLRIAKSLDYWED